MTKNELKPGDKVSYIPYKGCEEKYYQNGIVSQLSDIDGHVRVVYKCAEDWENFHEYTSALTNINDLKLGWNEENRNEEDCNRM